MVCPICAKGSLICKPKGYVVRRECSSLACRFVDHIHQSVQPIELDYKTEEVKNAK